MDCNFDQGACEWVQDKADNIDWSVAYHNDGNITIINVLLPPLLYHFGLISPLHLVKSPYKAFAKARKSQGQDFNAKKNKRRMKRQYNE